MKGLEGKTWEEQLMSLGLFTLRERSLRGNITVCNFLKRAAEEEMLICSLGDQQ